MRFDDGRALSRYLKPIPRHRMIFSFIHADALYHYMALPITALGRPHCIAENARVCPCSRAMVDDIRVRLAILSSLIFRYLRHARACRIDAADKGFR